MHNVLAGTAASRPMMQSDRFARASGLVKKPSAMDINERRSPLHPSTRSSVSPPVIRDNDQDIKSQDLRLYYSGGGGERARLERTRHGVFPDQAIRPMTCKRPHGSLRRSQYPDRSCTRGWCARAAWPDFEATSEDHSRGSDLDPCGKRVRIQLISGRCANRCTQDYGRHPFEE